jgi:hypothetical protein
MGRAKGGLSAALDIRDDRFAATLGARRGAHRPPELTVDDRTRSDDDRRRDSEELLAMVSRGELEAPLRALANFAEHIEIGYVNEVAKELLRDANQRAVIRWSGCVAELAKALGVDPPRFNPGARAYLDNLSYNYREHGGYANAAEFDAWVDACARACIVTAFDDLIRPFFSSSAEAPQILGLPAGLGRWGNVKASRVAVEPFIPLASGPVDDLEGRVAALRERVRAELRAE